MKHKNPANLVFHIPGQSRGRYKTGILTQV